MGNQETWVLRVGLIVLGVFCAMLPLTLALPLSVAFASPSWQATTLTLPSDWDGGLGGTLESVSCPAIGECGVTGSYEDTSGREEAMVASEAAGVWEAATKVALPSDATRTWADGELALCPSAGSCVATGQYFDSQGTNERPMVVADDSGTWGSAQQLLLPADASLDHPEGIISALSCPAAASCVGLGSYQADDNEAPMVSTETNGAWGTATRLTMPADTGAQQYADLIRWMDCGAVGFCSAVGRYQDDAGHYQALTINESNGVWSDAQQLPLPADAAAAHIAHLDEVTCPSVHFCEAIGGYFTDSGQKRPMVVSETDGVWGTPQELTAPPNSSFVGYQYSVSCSSPNSCAAGGDYLDNTPDQNRHAWVASETNGTWGPATTVTPPSDVSSIEPFAYISAVSCHQEGECDAIGGYLDHDANYQLMSVSQENGVWSGAAKIALQSGIAEFGPPTSCPEPHHCVVVSDNMVATETPGGPPISHNLSIAMSGTGSGTVVSVPTGIDCGTTCMYAFSEGTVITLTAVPTSGSTFTGWSEGGCSGVDSCDISLASDITVTATFSAAGNGGGGENPPDGSSPPVPTPTPHTKKPLKCRKGFKKKKVHGKTKCVKVKKKRRRHRG